MFALRLHTSAFGIDGSSWMISISTASPWPPLPRVGCAPIPSQPGFLLAPAVLIAVAPVAASLPFSAGEGHSDRQYLVLRRRLCHGGWGCQRLPLWSGAAAFAMS